MPSHHELKTAVVCETDCAFGSAWNNCCRAECLPDAGRVCNNQAGCSHYASAWTNNCYDGVQCKTSRHVCRHFQAFSSTAECKHDASSGKLHPNCILLAAQSQLHVRSILQKAKCSGSNKMQTSSISLLTSHRETVVVLPQVQAGDNVTATAQFL